ncbi:PAS/PAC sensor-containing diguanylate cyclase/phosphodiesterase [Rhodanobacter sp. Root179]|uniref:putative bifunctional diguanylate cyclase/phosphodiesterase n=1 Tax=unclassified Rhodanobacter TaxID=2621553 RepID=UPI000701BCEF|nr:MULTISPECIES: bifunctional diguanylate cyclase/phosphodiesterase [unclassified Rhodanobacter]KRB33946.1 diguanylate cyclase [Rhodanobacter sp. Root179]QRP65306.1 bifunctional diguanylate cyclase/phosphodiesterase [Rhodanobacter sp. FDAARGOS 1247]
MNSGILVVAAQRELRRNLFDALDQAGYPQIYSARDVPHAAILLEGRPPLPPLQLLVIVLAGDAQQARHACEQLRHLPGAAETPLIVVLADEATFGPADLPPGIADWLSAWNISDELIPRWRRSLAPEGMRARVLPPVPEAMVEPDGYRFTFEEGEGEWLIVDAQSGRLLEVSPTVGRHSRIHVDQWQGLPLAQVLRFEGIAISQVLTEANRNWYPCQRKSAQGADTGQASVRRIRHAGRDALALMFRSDRADLRAEAALSLLSRIFASTSGVDAQSAAGRLLFDELGLDYLAVWSARHEGAEAPNQMLQLWSGEDVAWPPAQLQSSLQLVLAGKSILYRTDAKRLAPIDPLLQQLELAGFAGLPLYDERHTVLGAMLAGTRRGFGEMSIIEPVLRCAVARFAQMLELGRTREQGRAEGLVDALTGLPNRLLFNDRLETIIREATRNGECFAVLFVDLDRFKAINDTYGHAAGDQVLRTVTQRLCGSIRASDTVARYAGDEFTIVLRHIVKNDDVMRVAEKIVQVMETPLYLEDGTELQVTASMGLSFFPDDAGDAATLLKHADEAMYAAKHQGRNTFQIYEISPEYAQQHGMALKTRLRHAEGNGELRVVYQPQVNTETEDIVGMEALVRWEHPELGMISPAVFIPLAEETGLIVSIGEWVMRTACRQAKEWEQRYGLRLRLGVNLSAVQLMEPHLLDTVAAVLRDTGLDPTLLEMEVTESISIKEAPNLVENLNALHRLGCHIAIDDFGTGAASLDYLRRLPADRIKIDQSFVRNIGVDPDDEAIVRATIEMAHRLNRAVVAEGVEIEQHLQFLRTNGCDELQGYLFCRPLPPISFDKLLAERQRLLEGRAAELA